MSSEVLLDATARDDVQEVTGFLEGMKEEYSNTVEPMFPGEQLEVLYVREYAAENGHDDIGESAEELLMSSNNHMMVKRFFQVYGGSVGAIAGFNLYDEMVDFGSAIGENSAEILEASAGSGEITSTLSFALLGGYALGEAYHKVRENDSVPVDVDGTEFFYDDDLAELREELSTEYGIDTYCKNPEIPKRYHGHD